MTRDILYFDEHASCRHYVSDYRCSFRYFEPNDGDEVEFQELHYNHLVFIIEGKIKISCNDFLDREFTEGNIFLTPKSAEIKCNSVGKTRLLCCLFDVPHNVCDKFNLHSYWTMCSQMKYNFDPLPIRPQLMSLIDSISYYLQQGVNCEHYHELKQQELFLILRWFYPKNELAYLFFPIIGKSLDFKALVLENYLKVSGVDELAELSRMGRSSFDTRFKKEFGVPAMQWILKQKSKHILHHMTAPGATIGDVMIKFGFNSATHFTRFCKQQFGCTPTELMNKHKEDQSA